MRDICCVYVLSFTLDMIELLCFVYSNIRMYEILQFHKRSLKYFIGEETWINYKHKISIVSEGQKINEFEKKYAFNLVLVKTNLII